MILQCHNVNKDTGEECNFVLRQSKSPSPTPTQPADPTFNGPSLSSSASIPQVARQCPVSTCGQTRLADDCPRRLCRKHCIEKGGCGLKKHMVSTATTALALPPHTLSLPFTSFIPTPSFLPTSSFSPTSSLPPLTQQTEARAYSPPSQPDRSTSPEVVDARGDPRFASHLHPIFTNIVAEQQELSRQQRDLEAERREKAQKAKHRIAVYVWNTEDTPHKVKFVQDFTWPYFSISSTLIANIGFSEATERGDLQIYDEVDIADWVGVDIGYVIEVCEGQHIFLKDAALQKCPGFQQCLDVRPSSITPHLHLRLPHERSYVREMLKAKSPSPSTPSSSPPSSMQLPVVVTSSVVESTPSLSPPVSIGQPSSGSTGPPNDPIELSDSEELAKRWPADYYVVDIARCLRECSARTTRVHHRARNQQDVFYKHFPGVRFTASTFSDQKSLWNKAGTALREEFIEMGRCDGGLWSTFARRVRRARNARARSKDVIDIV